MPVRRGHIFRRWSRYILQTHRLYTHILLAATTTLSGIEATLVHGTTPQDIWIALAVLSAASISTIEGSAHRGTYRRLGVPKKLPELPKTYVERPDDIRVLQERFDEQRGARRADHDQSNSPVLIYIHGPLGAGKSILAVAFAKGIERHYPDGTLHENLGTVGDPRDTGEVLGSLLDQLQTPASSLDTQRRAELFQSVCANRRMLIVLDAARDSSQITSLLPRNSKCAVIITSRRRIGGANSHLVQSPSTDEATKILYAYAGRTHSNTYPENVAEIVELSGRLPLALRSAGEQVAENKSFEELALLLRPAAERLTRLDHGGHLIKKRILSEYERLSEADKLGLCRLALLPTTTFLPWVVAPLLDIGIEEANNTVTRLSEAQFVQIADRDPSGLKRYRLSPLIWCFANEELQGDPGSLQAEERLREYRQNVISEIIIRIDPELEGRLPRRINHGEPLGGGLDWLQRLAKNPSYWNRSEYGSLVKAIGSSFSQGEWELCWRIAAQLGSCVPRYLNPQAYLPCFDKALTAARQMNDEIGQIRVLLSQAESLVALERYNEAIEIWSQVQQKCSDTALRRDHTVEIEALETELLRNEGEAWLQLGCYAHAQGKFMLAKARAAESKNSIEESLITVLMAESDTSMHLEHWQDKEAYQSTDRSGDSTRFRASLGFSEAARRRGQWAEARSFLDSAMSPNYGDARRRAAVEYRHGRLCLSESRAMPTGSTRNALANAAVGHGATALVRFQGMENYIGCVRARCLLARALIAAGQLSEAEYQIKRAHQDAEQIASLPSDSDLDVRSPCTARIDRAEGELLLAQDRFGDAEQRLDEAARLFETLGDSWSRADTMLLLGKAHRGSRQYTRAMRYLFEARVAFEQCRDIASLTETVREQAKVTREQPTNNYSIEAQDLERQLRRPRGTSELPAARWQLGWRRR
jgi:tetratricopeptide (TPR) repeat protein